MEGPSGRSSAFGRNFYVNSDSSVAYDLGLASSEATPITALDSTGRGSTSPLVHPSPWRTQDIDLDARYEFGIDVYGSNLWSELSLSPSSALERDQSPSRRNISCPYDMYPGDVEMAGANWYEEYQPTVHYIGDEYSPMDMPRHPTTIPSSDHIGENNDAREEVMVLAGRMVHISPVQLPSPSLIFNPDFIDWIYASSHHGSSSTRAVDASSGGMEEVELEDYPAADVDVEPFESLVTYLQNDLGYEEILALQERLGYESAGLNEDTILKNVRQRRFQPLTSDHALGDPSCCICQCEYSEGQEVGELRCGHEFHFECINQWLQHKNSCPLCRASAS